MCKVTSKHVRAFEKEIISTLKGLMGQGKKNVNAVQPGIRPDGLLAGSKAALDQMRANYASGIDLFDGTLLSQSDYDTREDE